MQNDQTPRVTQPQLDWLCLARGINNLAFNLFAKALLGCNAYADYVPVAQPKYQLMQANFSAFWYDIGPLARQDFLTLVSRQLNSGWR